MGEILDILNSMRSLYTFLLILRICHATPTDRPQGSGEQSIQQAAPLNSSLSSAIYNSSYLSDQLGVPTNGTLGDSPNIRCDGKKYGFNPDIADCQTAIQYFLPSRMQLTYAQRGTPSQKGNVFPLPLRIMGGMYNTSRASSNIKSKSRQ